MIASLKSIVDLAPFVGTPPVEGVRYNPLKCERERFLALVPFSVTPSPYCREGFRITGGEPSGNHPLHLAGLWYFQEPSAMSAVTALDPAPGDRVLDLCAAPGSKASAIAGRLTTGFLVANEIRYDRAKILASNLERMGVRRAAVTSAPPETLAAEAPEAFDRVLVDSPCSGEGMFRKIPRISEEWTPELVALCAARSRGILEEAAKTVRPGGRLVYSTCTFNTEENEKTVLGFLADHPEFSPVPTGVTGAPGLCGLTAATRIFPGAEGEGHFVCALQKSGEAPPRALPGYQPERHAEAAAFLRELGAFPPDDLFLKRGSFYYLTPGDLPAFKKTPVLRAGVQALEERGRQLRPAHHLALSFPAEQFAYSLPQSTEEAARYLRGETLPCAAHGWGVVTVEGAPLGWIKSADGQAKNHYPKGLRIP